MADARWKAAQGQLANATRREKRCVPEIIATCSAGGSQYEHRIALMGAMRLLQSSCQTKRWGLNVVRPLGRYSMNKCAHILCSTDRATSSCTCVRFWRISCT